MKIFYMVIIIFPKFCNSSIDILTIRSKKLFWVVKISTAKKKHVHKHFYYLGAKCWNTLPSYLRNLDDAGRFSKIYKAELLHSITNDPKYLPNNSFDVFYKPIKPANMDNFIDLPVQIRGVLDSVRNVTRNIVGSCST